MTELINRINETASPSFAADVLICMGLFAAIAGFYLLIRYSKKPERKNDNSGS